MVDDLLPGGIVRDANLTVLPGEFRPRQGRAWLVDWNGTRGVLRQLPPPGLASDARWLHAFLARLAETEFPAPRPLPAFSGRSWTMEAGQVWELVSFLPGLIVGWAAEPSMEEVGALLGRYHAAVRRIDVASQRPSALPLADVPEILLSRQLETARVRRDEAGVIRDLAEQLAREVRETTALTAGHVVIHGDFTNHNVLATGTPPRPSGVIDFALAHLETSLADIGYGLWRSSRPYQEADYLDLSRVRRFLRGYASIARISSDQARVIRVYLMGRGLQMIAKRVRAGRAETGMLTQVRWLSENASAVGDALAASVP
jgi:Ser/Thr protein kinase RdoA (MazF antagonist)